MHCPELHPAIGAFVRSQPPGLVDLHRSRWRGPLPESKKQVAGYRCRKARCVNAGEATVIGGPAHRNAIPQVQGLPLVLQVTPSGSRDAQGEQDSFDCEGLHGCERSRLIRLRARNAGRRCTRCRAKDASREFIAG